MKKFAAIFLVLFVLVTSSFAADVVNVDYGSKYHTYQCSQPYKLIERFPRLGLDGGTYCVGAYCPGNSILYYILFAKYSDAVDFCQQYVSVTNTLRRQESCYRLDVASVNVTNLVIEYAPKYFPDLDFYENGQLCRFATSL